MASLTKILEFFQPIEAPSLAEESFLIVDWQRRRIPSATHHTNDATTIAPSTGARRTRTAVRRPKLATVRKSSGHTR